MNYTYKDLIVSQNFEQVVQKHFETIFSKILESNAIYNLIEDDTEEILCDYLFLHGVLRRERWPRGYGRGDVVAIDRTNRHFISNKEVFSAKTITKQKIKETFQQKTLRKHLLDAIEIVKQKRDTEDQPFTFHLDELLMNKFSFVHEYQKLPGHSIPNYYSHSYIRKYSHLF